MLKRNTLSLILLVLIYDQDIVSAFNLSPVPNMILKMPEAKTEIPKVRSSYFGYTIVLRKESIIIAAPRAQSLLADQTKINETGAIFRCPIKFSFTGNSVCHVLPIDSQGNHYDSYYLKYELKDHQWLGASMDGGPEETDALLICAPRFVAGYDVLLQDEYLHGICYWTTGTESNSNNNTNTNTKMSVKTLKSLTDPVKQRYKDHDLFIWNYQLGEQGFSAHITPNGREFLMGAPGIALWRGSIIHYDIATGKTKIPEKFLHSFSYGGYAVSSGYLDSNNRDKIIYVATTIHSTAHKSHEGVAILYELTSSGEAIEMKTTLHGEHYGELFGYAIVIEDVNCDDLDDLIISAPLYASNDTVDVGTVYVFLNTGGFYFTSKRIASPFKNHARFGTTIAKIGDINRDGYPDIAIGAPFADAHGAVALYLGGPDGLQESASQILGMNPPIEAAMFGHGLSKGVDIDGNGFNDLAVGAPESEIVYIYRSYPVVNLKTKIVPQRPHLELNETELEVEFCFQMETESMTMTSIEIHLEIEVDPEIRRLTFRENNDNRFELYANATRHKECQTFVGVVKFLPLYVFTPMDLVLRYRLIHDVQHYGKEEYCEKCAVLEPTCRRVSRSSVNYIHGCKESICKVDLRIKTYKMPTDFTFGSSNTLFVEYFIENLGEKAFDAKFEVTTSLNVSHSKIPSNCIVGTENGNRLICSLFLRTGFTGNTTLEIGFDMSHVSQVPEMNITAIASSGGHEIEPKDNSFHSSIKLSTLSTLEILGNSNETFVSILDITGNLDVFYKFKLQNNGPSTLYNINYWIFVPAAYTDSKNFTRNFLNLESSHARVLVKGYQLSAVGFEMGKSISEIQARANQSIGQQEIHVEQQLLPKNRTLSLSFNTTNYKNFASVRIANLQFRAGGYIEVVVVLNIVPEAMKEILKKRFDYLELYMDLAVEPLSKEDVKLNITKKIAPAIIVNIAPPGTPVWVYIISIMGGLLLLTLVALGLRKLGFFKRQTKEDMEQMINDKLEKERMKAELETEIRNTIDSDAEL